MLPAPQKKPDFELQKNQPVMEQVKKQREPAQPMDVLQILEKSAGSREEAIKLYNGLADLVTNDPDFRVMRANNTLFMYNNNKDGSVDITMETVDSPNQFDDSLKQFCDAMKIAGFKMGNFEIDNPQIIQSLKKIRQNVNMILDGGVMPDGVTPSMIAVVGF